jgi:hypothetical protein
MSIYCPFDACTSTACTAFNISSDNEGLIWATARATHCLAPERFAVFDGLPALYIRHGVIQKRGLRITHECRA